MSGENEDLFPNMVDEAMGEAPLSEVPMDGEGEGSYGIDEGAFENNPQDIKPPFLDMELVPEGTNELNFNLSAYLVIESSC